ncbi:MAG: riboflavin biosynthesis protein RibF [Candidatus Eisenbacteria bacterium]|nr:riboflavin biosynthesis protein RibF [Candidatus Eisenbacteria bacterium]
MRVIRSVSELGGPPPRAAAAIGVFDGVHAGHREIFERTMRAASSLSATSAVFTFDPHPRAVLPDARSPRILTTLDEKLHILERLGIELTVVIPFDRAFASMSAEEFVDSWLVSRLDLRRVVIGYDFRLGRDRAANGAALGALGEARGFEVDRVPPFVAEGRPVKSTWIRDEIEAGNVGRAASLLRRFHSLAGFVGRGEGRGESLGFPTANLAVSEREKLWPRDGVYAAFAEIPGKVVGAVANIGVRPTFGGGGERRVEAHLLRYRETLRGVPLALHFVDRIRDERAFPSVDALVSRVREDCREAERILASAVPTFAFTRF